MAYRRILYLIAAAGCLVFYWAYREWLSWFLLMAVVWLPWLSLGVSLPALLRSEARVQCPEAVTLGQSATVRLSLHSRLPAPPVTAHIRIRHSLTGKQLKRTNGCHLPTDHCGMLELRFDRSRKYDYLGLFSGKLRRAEPIRIPVRPVPVPVSPVPDLSRYLVNSFKPKPGGGYAENHELRLYRPGDNLHQIHWKLSAKTGKLILREPMEALRGLALVTLELSGTPPVLDEKLGKLLWLSRYLIGQQVPHQIHCLTGHGLEQLPIRTEADILPAIDTLLAAPAAPAEAVPQYIPAAWRCHIGGGDDEA